MRATPGRPYNWVFGVLILFSIFIYFVYQYGRHRAAPTIWVFWILILFPVFISSDYQYGRHRVAPTIEFSGYWYCSLYLYLLIINTGDYNFSSAQVRFRSFRCERLHLTFLNSAFALLGFIGIGHERGRPYNPTPTNKKCRPGSTF